MAWRCLYAELVRGRVEDVKPVIKNAYRRTLIMLVTRLTAYGENGYDGYERTEKLATSLVFQNVTKTRS